ncbi:hypothetical protein EIP86_009621 [Pleurotus ostreatoroseus]|nr:hypothetical protein EIP86_009621 [Pleurotus ostreatoroseus]
MDPERMVDIPILEHPGKLSPIWGAIVPQKNSSLTSDVGLHVDLEERTIGAHEGLDFVELVHSHNIKLYVRQMFITDDCQGLIPEYLNFIHGIIDFENLPLNSSSESICKSITDHCLDLLVAFSEDTALFSEFYKVYGGYLKLGIEEDGVNRETLLRLTHLLNPDETSLPEKINADASPSS